MEWLKSYKIQAKIENNVRCTICGNVLHADFIAQNCTSVCWWDGKHYHCQLIQLWFLLLNFLPIFNYVSVTVTPPLDILGKFPVLCKVTNRFLLSHLFFFGMQWYFVYMHLSPFFCFFLTTALFF